MKFENEIQEMGFQKRAKEIDLIGKEITGVKISEVHIRCHDSNIGWECFITNTAGVLEQGL